ncbi:hypothetical protein CVT24_009537 [Panaeolus cyanescens]|uniref:MARVEL domain-containing protein n=1 Tax=Panaeolus cyanescens TaxID=181874 RepID=A0A409YAD7_9AGAR|nr:hypothetical protein CVT24_009537 [Panaeolus cyanescens]
MAYVRSRKFCCCLPVRFGVFILALLSMAGGSFVAATGWIRITQLAQLPLPKADEIALWIQTIMFSILALLSVFGFIGAMVKNRSWVSAFATAMAIHLGLSVAAGIFALISLFRQDDQPAIDKCTNGDTESLIVEGCKKGIQVMKGVMVAVYVLVWLVQLYAYFIVERYADQLDEEESANNVVVIPRAMANSAAPPVTTYNTTYNSYNPSGTSPYPFNEPRQAFGVTPGQDPSQRV